MQIENESQSLKLLRQVYEDICQSGEVSLKTSMKVTDYLMNLSDLALGKPRPLAKNKQFDNACDKCGGTGLMKQELISTCNRCYGFGNKRA